MATITLEQAAIILHSRLRSLSSEVRQAESDSSADGYGPDLDHALRRMDKDSVSELTLNKEIAAFLILARYYALSRFAALISTRVDTEGYAVEGDRQAIFDNVVELMAATAREAAAYGYIVETSSLSQVGSANEDIDQSESTAAWARGVFDTGYIAPNDPHLWPLEGVWI